MAEEDKHIVKSVSVAAAVGCFTVVCGGCALMMVPPPEYIPSFALGCGVCLIGAIAGTWLAIHERKNRTKTWWAVAIVAAIGWLVASVTALSIIDPQSSNDEPKDIIRSYGMDGPPGYFYVVVDSSAIKTNRRRFRLMLIMHVEHADIDGVTDPAIDKSVGFVITGKQMTIGLNFDSNSRLKVSHIGSNHIRYIVAAIPAGAVASVHSISDVPRLGGSVLEDQGQVIGPLWIPPAGG